MLPVDNTILQKGFSSFLGPKPDREIESQDSPLGVSLKPVKHSAFGRLKAYANPSLIPEEKGAWEKAAAEKYALH